MFSLILETYRRFSRLARPQDYKKALNAEYVQNVS